MSQYSTCYLSFVHTARVAHEQHAQRPPALMPPEDQQEEALLQHM